MKSTSNSDGIVGEGGNAKMNNQPELAVGDGSSARVLSKTRRGMTSSRQWVWLRWEKTIGRIMDFTSEYAMEAGICKLLVKRHKGDDIVCADGTRIVKGDLVGELHLNNQTIHGLTLELGANRAAMQTARLVRKSLKEINEALETRTDLSQVKALVGVTMLHRGLTHGLGFEQRRLTSKRFEKISALYLRLLLFCMHPDGLERIGRNKEKLTPLMLIISKDALARKFFSKSSECSREVPKDCSL